MRTKTLARVAAHETHPDLFPSDEVIEFIYRCRKDRDEKIALQSFWVDVVEASLPGPGSPNSTMSFVTVHNYTQEFAETSYIDVEATTKVLAKVIKWAHSKGYAVEKVYEDTYFIVKVYVPELDRKIEFRAARQTVCERRVTGTETVPATTKEIVEWDCKTISFLGIDTDD